MIKNVTLRVNGRDLSSRLSTYDLTHEVTYAGQLTSINGVEHNGKKRIRDVLTFSLFPASPDTIKADRAVLEAKRISVDYTDPSSSLQPAGVEMTLQSDLDDAFLVSSVDGNNYYGGAPIVLRARRPR